MVVVHKELWLSTVQKLSSEFRGRNIECNFLAGAVTTIEKSNEKQGEMANLFVGTADIVHY